MPKRILFIVILLLNYSIYGSIQPEKKLFVGLEQIGLPITKSFSIRANSIREIRVNLDKGVVLKKLSLELSNGTYLDLDTKKIKGLNIAKWSTESISIKTITFTAKASSTRHNQVELVLGK